MPRLKKIAHITTVKNNNKNEISLKKSKKENNPFTVIFKA